MRLALTNLFFGVTINRVHGKFECKFKNLTSLDGSPKHVDGDYDVSHNQLESVRYIPNHIYGNLDITHNYLKILTGFPKDVDGSVFIYMNAPLHDNYQSDLVWGTTGAIKQWVVDHTNIKTENLVV